MQVEHAIILAAGKGTRMGAIGKLLAKPLWPFFGYTLLDLQIKFLNEKFGIKTFYINSHHLADQFNNLKQSNITIVHEPVLLDQGGGILNIAKKYNLWNTPLLINNADQFYFFEKKFFDKGIEKLKETPAVLFGLEVKKEDGYNELVLDSNEQLKEIRKNQDTKSEVFSTYSGMSLLKIEEQKYEGEIISFFESVGDFKKKPVHVQEVQNTEYYDFGKLSTYFNLCTSTMSAINSGESNKVTDLIGSAGLNYCLKYGIDFRVNQRTKSDNILKLDQGEIYKEGNSIKEKVTLKK